MSDPEQGGLCAHVRLHWLSQCYSGQQRCQTLRYVFEYLQLLLPNHNCPYEPISIEYSHASESMGDSPPYSQEHETSCKAYSHRKTKPEAFNLLDFDRCQGTDGQTDKPVAEEIDARSGSG